MYFLGSVYALVFFVTILACIQPPAAAQADPKAFGGKQGCKNDVQGFRCTLILANVGLPLGEPSLGVPKTLWRAICRCSTEDPALPNRDDAGRRGGPGKDDGG